MSEIIDQLNKSAELQQLSITSKLEDIKTKMCNVGYHIACRDIHEAIHEEFGNEKEILVDLEQFISMIYTIIHKLEEIRKEA